jgi:hypothetical protein
MGLDIILFLKMTCCYYGYDMKPIYEKEPGFGFSKKRKKEGDPRFTRLIFQKKRFTILTSWKKPQDCKKINFTNKIN